MTLIGKPSPAWCATSYVDGEEKQLSSEDYKGRWHLLYWYPLDFTFVCPSEILAFDHRLDEFRKRDCEVIGVSVDSDRAALRESGQHDT